MPVGESMSMRPNSAGRGIRCVGIHPKKSWFRKNDVVASENASVVTAR